MSKNQDDLSDLLLQNYFNTPSVVYMMVLLRKLLEEKGQKHNIKQLNFYCNWAVHPTLDKEKTCQSFLIQLTNILHRLPLLDRYVEIAKGVSIWDPDTSLDKEINKALGLPLLRQEIINFLQILNLPSGGFIDDQKWALFSEILCVHLVNQRIKAPDQSDKKYNAFASAIQCITSQKDRQALAFELVYSRQLPPGLRRYREDYKYFFQIETMDGAFFVGPFWVI